MIQATLELYFESAKDALEARRLTALAIVALVVGALAIAVLARVLGYLPSGAQMVGGFALGALQAAAVGWYLSLVEIGINGRRSIRMSDLQEQLGAYFNEVISVLFIFFIAELVLSY